MRKKVLLFLALIILLAGGNVFVPVVYGDYGDWDGTYQEEGIHAGYHSGGTQDPRIMGWATEVVDYWRPEGINFGTPDLVLDQPGGTYDVFSLGDGGWITIAFEQAVTNGPGPDLAVWENGFVNVSVPPLGMLFAELMFVEVSSNGIDFARFPSVCLNPATEPIGGFGCIDPTYYHNVGGKHPNGNDGRDEGTPFDLDDLLDDPLVINGTVDLNNIQYVRLVDVIGDGSTYDSLGNPMWDPYPTPFGSGGADLDAVCILKNVYILHLGMDEDGNDIFPQELAQELYYTGASVGLMTMRFLYPSYPESQSYLYSTYHSGAPGEDMSAVDVKNILQDETNAISELVPYNFVATADSDEDHAIKRFIYWMDYQVSGVEEPNVPVQLPTDGAYSNNWKTVRGFVTSEDPFVNWQMPDFTVLGLWLNDPKINGLGFNFYAIGEEFKDMYETVEGSYRYVAEPPEDSVLNALDAGMDAVEISYLEGKSDAGLANALSLQKRLVMSPDEFISQTNEEMKKAEALYSDIRWQELVPNELKVSPDFNGIFSQTSFNGVLKVTDLTTGEDYALALFSQSGKANTASVVLMLGEETGGFRQATWTGEDQAYLPLSVKEAMKIARKVLVSEVIELDADLLTLDQKIRLVWDKDFARSRFLPAYEISLEGGIIYVFQDGSYSVE